MAGIEAALDCHTLSAAERAPDKTAAALSNVQKIIDEIAGGVLPIEILGYIAELVVPPAMLDFSSRPSRRFRNESLYLTQDRAGRGPLLVYSDPADFWPCLTTVARHPSRQRSQWADDRELEVRDPQSWMKVSDEIHTLWTLYTPQRVPMEPSQMPWIEMILELPQDTEGGDFDGFRNGCIVKQRLHSDRPVVTPLYQPVSRESDNMYEIIDLETNHTLPELDCSLEFNDPDFDNLTFTHGRDRTRAWAQGLTKPPFPPTPGRPWLRTLRPDRTKDEWDYSHDLWFTLGRYEGLLIHGHRYALKLRDDVVVRRWAFGTENKCEGPWNMPPMRVVMSEQSDLTFRYLAPAPPE